ncbi:hypothetical protein, partial [Streptomyces sp. SID161]|uniref:hypothetical protein n=1 Tax=Streptomyces sp. SID161 TaxID=2690251 RepID=UPI001F38A92D
YDVPLRLTSAATAGEACVWCGRAADATTVELEPSASLPREGCMPCYLARLTWYITWYDWHDHFQGCAFCQQRHTCHVGHGRRILHEQTVGPSDVRAECGICPAPLRPTELVAPLLWEGSSHMHLGYAHLRCLTRKATVR